MRCSRVTRATEASFDLFSSPRPKPQLSDHDWSIDPLDRSDIRREPQASSAVPMGKLTGARSRVSRARRAADAAAARDAPHASRVGFYFLPIRTASIA